MFGFAWHTVFTKCTYIQYIQYIYKPRPSKGWQMDSEIWCSEGVPNGHPFWPLRRFYLIWLIMSKLMRFILRLSNLGKYVWSSSTQIGAKTTRKWHVLEVPFGAWHVFKGVSISNPLHWRGVHLPPLTLKGCPFAILFKTPLTRKWHGMTRAKYLCLCNLRCQLVVAYHGVGIWCTCWLSIKYLSNHDHNLQCPLKIEEQNTKHKGMANENPV